MFPASLRLLAQLQIPATASARSTCILREVCCNPDVRLAASACTFKFRDFLQAVRRFPRQVQQGWESHPQTACKWDRLPSSVSDYRIGDCMSSIMRRLHSKLALFCVNAFARHGRRFIGLLCDFHIHNTSFGQFAVPPPQDETAVTPWQQHILLLLDPRSNQNRHLKPVKRVSGEFGTMSQPGVRRQHRTFGDLRLRRRSKSLGPYNDLLLVCMGVSFFWRGFKGSPKQDRNFWGPIKKTPICCPLFTPGFLQNGLRPSVPGCHGFLVIQPTQSADALSLQGLTGSQLSTCNTHLLKNCYKVGTLLAGSIEGLQS